jgi:septal ring factor EnvC (AmiA/AmiB activator)
LDKDEEIRQLKKKLQMVKNAVFQEREQKAQLEKQIEDLRKKLDKADSSISSLQNALKDKVMQLMSMGQESLLRMRSSIVYRSRNVKWPRQFRI